MNDSKNHEGELNGSMKSLLTLNLSNFFMLANQYGQFVIISSSCFASYFFLFMRNDILHPNSVTDGLKNNRSTMPVSTSGSRWKSILNSIAKQVSQVCEQFLFLN